MENQELIKQITDILGSTSEAAISEYAKWHLTAAITWMVASAIALGFLIRWKTANTEWVKGLAICVKIALICLTGIIFFSYIPDLINPKAISIHQLLIDLK